MANIPESNGNKPRKNYAGSNLHRVDALSVGLTLAPRQLAEIRRKRFDMPKGSDGDAYSDIDAVSEEVREVRRMIVRRGWPVIDVTSRSIDQTAATIMDRLDRHRQQRC